MSRARETSPWVVHIVDLRRRLGERRTVALEASTARLDLAGSAVAAGTPIRLTVELESIPAGVACTGQLAADWSGTCRRCLGEVGGRLAVDVSEVFATDHVDGDTYPLGAETIDLEPLVRDAVLLALPTAPLCREGCEGPDPQGFPVAREGEGVGTGVDEPPPVDPRWAGLEAARAALEGRPPPPD